MTKQDNGSYLIKSNLTSKYIKIENNNFILSDLVEDDHNFQFYFESNDNPIFIENNAEYTNDGRFIKKIVDANLNEIKYDIDLTNNLIKSVTNSKNQTMDYNYNEKKQIEFIKTKDKNINYMYNTNNTLSKIIQNDRIYNFEYDNFLNIKKIKIGDNITLIENTYGENNDNLKQIKYGNNQIINYKYDEFDRLKQLIKNNDTYNYIYNNNGDLAKIISNNDIAKYTYDLSKRLYKYNFNKFKIKYIYDDNNNVIEKKYELGDNVYEVSNKLNDNDILTSLSVDSNNFNYEYDDLGRLLNKNINGKNKTNYKYKTNGKRTTTIIDSISNNNDTYKYEYDELGNIIKIYHNEVLENEYNYDDYNELIREDNYLLNKTIKYFYNELGNIIYKKEYEIKTDNQLSEVIYDYGNSYWKDQLTKYNSDVIIYDEIGNPQKIGENISLNWINGRQLNSYIDLNNTVNYKYNAEGIRINKTVNNILTRYYLEGQKIIFEQTGENVIYYIYSDIDGLIGFKYNDNMYYYQKNCNNDIIKILDNSYNIVGIYNYDSWGNIMYITDKDGNDVSNNLEHIANINPFRYRSYYYDKETKLYYLNSRYYNPRWGRFINADNYISTDSGPLGDNMYLYCNNNPISYVDSDGNSILAGMVIGIAAVGTVILLNSINRMKKAKKEIKKVQNKKNIPDRTKQLNETLKKNADNMERYIYPNQPPVIKMNNFINNVKENGPMDLKNIKEFQSTISYNGIIMEPQDVGNFNFGYIGRAYGYSTEFLADGAGAYQLYRHWKNPVTYLNCLTPSVCDDPRDTYFVRMGAIKYDQDFKK